MEKRAFKINLFVTACLIIMLLSIVLSFGAPSLVYADTTNTSSVLDDLRLDSNFDVGKYPSNSKDVGTYVIQIAESVNKDLFIYTYQPCQRSYSMQATKVNMSASKSIEATKLYTLTLLSQEGVFCKYKVDDFKVSTKDTRYYNISSIYRKWLSGTDADVGNDNTVNESAFKVGQVWTVKTTGDTVRYDMYEEEVITITNQYVGMRRYSEGLRWENSPSCDSHFLAFSCEHNIDKLLSATVEFDTTAYKTIKGGIFTKDNYTEDAPVHHTANLYDYQVASTNGSGWFGDYKEWHRMSSMEDFIKEVGITGDEKTNLEKFDWILNFYETEYECAAGGKDFIIALISSPIAIINARTTRGEKVSNVALLRLEFEYEGEIYNLGVVSNIQTGTNEPTNSEEKFDLLKWLEEKTGIPKGVWIALPFILVGVILLPILASVFPAFGELLKIILKGLGYVLKYLFIALWWLICLPFKGIKVLIIKIKERREV